MELTERSTSTRFASRCVDRRGVDRSLLANWRSTTSETPGRRVERASRRPQALGDSEAVAWRVRPIDPPMTIPDRRAGQSRIDQPSMIRHPPTRARARAPLRLNVRWARPTPSKSRFSETFRGTWSDLRKYERAPDVPPSVALPGGTSPVIARPQDSPQRSTAGLDGERTTTAAM